MLLERFFPDETAHRAWDIDFARFYGEGRRTVLFDIDNTLVYPDAPADARCRRFLDGLKERGFRIYVISNNKGPRVERFAKDCGIGYVAKAGKPMKKGYQRAMALSGSDPDTTLFVGDQLFTDVWGARRLGIYSILVEPMTKREEIQIVLKRWLEKPVLRRYRGRKQADEH